MKPPHNLEKIRNKRRARCAADSSQEYSAQHVSDGAWLHPFYIGEISQPDHEAETPDGYRKLETSFLVADHLMKAHPGEQEVTRQVGEHS